jgi:hypothetical protein
MEYEFTLSEIEQAFDSYGKSCGMSDEVIADAWHGLVVGLAVIGANKVPSQIKEPPAIPQQPQPKTVRLMSCRSCDGSSTSQVIWECVGKCTKT